MTFKLPSLPSARAAHHELADFAELVCWEQGEVSERQVIAYLGQIDDNEYNEGCDDDEDEAGEYLPEVMNEIERRSEACRGGYPFRLSSTGTVLFYKDELDESIESLVYRYLLLSTRLDMQKDKIHAGIDGTELLEHLSAHVLQQYLGSRSRSMVFGTAIASTFPKRISNLCQNVGEGINFRPLDQNATVTANDDKLDAVAWVPFTDCDPGKLVVFAQCKTGTNWQSMTTQLQPTDFIKRWMLNPYLVDPIRALFISEAINRARWGEFCTSAGLLFDRCRIVDYCEGFDMAEIKDWVTAAHAQVQMVSQTKN
ncbi:hypothetical protein AB1K70_26725 [Bremerella sp. JC770]|uniref:hypothetical protein n=1 Tax=Bremerella sp. JC770 TaxID=3232137 RepID=UPI00345A08CE